MSTYEPVVYASFEDTGRPLVIDDHVYEYETAEATTANPKATQVFDYRTAADCAVYAAGPTATQVFDYRTVEHAAGSFLAAAANPKATQVFDYRTIDVGEEEEAYAVPEEEDPYAVPMLATSDSIGSSKAPNIVSRVVAEPEQPTYENVAAAEPAPEQPVYGFNENTVAATEPVEASKLEQPVYENDFSGFGSAQPGQDTTPNTHEAPLAGDNTYEYSDPAELAAGAGGVTVSNTYDEPPTPDAYATLEAAAYGSQPVVRATVPSGVYDALAEHDDDGPAPPPTPSPTPPPTPPPKRVVHTAELQAQAKAQLEAERQRRADAKAQQLEEQQAEQAARFLVKEEADAQARRERERKERLVKPPDVDSFFGSIGFGT